MTGTAAELTQLREIDDIAIGEGEPGPITRQIQELFGSRYDDRELTELGALLARLGGDEPAECEPPE